MSKKSKRKYLYEISGRYNKTGNEEKVKILDEFCSVCCYHRKYTIRLLNNSTLQEISKQVKRNN